MKLPFAALLAFAATASAADPRLLNLVMPDAKMLAGMNVTAAKNSPLGQFLLARFQENPLENVTEVLAASSGGKGEGLLLMLGNFDPAKAGKKFTLIGNNIAVTGDPDAVAAAVARASGTNSLDPGLLAQVTSLSATEDAWVVSTTSPGGMLPDQAGQFLASVKSFSGGVKFGENVPVNLNVVADTPQNAEALGNVVKLLLSMAGPNSATLLQGLQMNTTGSTLDLALTIPEAQLEAMIPR